MTVDLRLGDMLAVLPTLDANSVDAVVTDPPYDLTSGGSGGFMNKAWDGTGIAFKVETWQAVLRVMKPGGFLLAMGGTRTIHRMICAIEDAGFEVRDQIAWMHSQGFPKSMDLSKQFDRMAPRAGMFEAFAAHFADRRKASALTQKQIAAHFPSKTGGMTGCVWNWENGANVPTLEQWHILQPMIGLSDEWLPLIERIEAEREVIGQDTKARATGSKSALPTLGAPVEYQTWDITAPATDLARQWAGWGTALKPAMELICMARKPLDKGLGVAANVARWSTGGLNIDASRVGGPTGHGGGRKATGGYHLDDTYNHDGFAASTAGRWPSNVVMSHAPGCVEVGTRRVRTGATNSRADTGIFDPGPAELKRNGWVGPDGMEEVSAWQCEPQCPVRLLDEQSGVSKSSGKPRLNRTTTIGGNGIYRGGVGMPTAEHEDVGGASRFFKTFPPEADPGEVEIAVPFIYQSKASRRERNAGLEAMPEQDRKPYAGGMAGISDPRMGHEQQRRPAANTHPTVKSVSLMRYLVRMVTPPSGVVLDPFAGSGSTGVACVMEGFDFIGVEMDESYMAIATARIEAAATASFQLELL